MRSAIYHLSSRAYTFSQVPLRLAEMEKLKCEYGFRVRNPVLAAYLSVLLQHLLNLLSCFLSYKMG